MSVNSSQYEPAAPRSDSGLEYRVLSDLSEVSEITHEWDRLLAASECNRAFGSAEWYIGSCRVHSAWTPYLVTANRGTETVGILPLVLNPEDGVARFPHYMNDYNDVVARADSPSLAADLLSHALSPQGRCKKIVLSRLRQDSNCVKATPFIASNPDIDFIRRKIHEYRYIKLPRSFDDYLASRSRAFRKGIRRAQRRIENSRLTVRELLPDDFDAARLSELSISLAIARQRDESFFMRAQAQSFVREVFPLCFRKRSLRAFAVFDAEQVIALDLCMARANGLGAWNGGFLPEAGRWSPGAILFAFGIKQSIDMGLEEYDFMLGDEAYKSSWASDSYSVSEVQLTAKGEAQDDGSIR
jgi:CelD/BcsL family acetyltransferase involved in cellulose biosynthesis